MAEQAVVADLRIGLNKFDADLKKAMASADKASANISKSLNRVENSIRPLPGEFNKISQSLQRVEQSTNRAAAASEKHTQILGRMKGALASLGLLIGAREALGFAASMVKSAEAMTGVQQQLTKLTGSTQATAQQMQFIRAETDRLALSTLEGAKAYARIANASKGTAIEGEGVKRVFTALNELSRANRLSAEQYGNIMNQVTQIISKGRVQTEELVTISEAGIPAFRLLGEAMGVTGKQLADMLQKGQVSADNILLLADKISQEYGDLADQAANTIPAKFTRGLNQIKMEFVDLASGILNSSQFISAIEFDSGIMDIFPDPSVISDTVNNIVTAYTTIAEMARIIFQGVRDVIIKAFNDVVTYLQGILAPIDNFFKGLRDKAFNFFKDTFGVDVAKNVEGVTSSLGQLSATIGNITTADTGDILSQFSGEKGRKLLQTLDSAKKKVAEFFGVAAQDQPILLDPIVVEANGKKVEDTHKKLLDKLRAEAKKTSTLVDEEKEKKAIDAAAKHAEETIKAMRKRLAKEAEQEQKDYADLVKSNQENILKAELAVFKEQEKAQEEYAEFVKRNQEMILKDELDLYKKGQEERQRAFDETIENMKENIQSSMATMMSDAMRGDIDSIQDVFDTVTDMAVDMSATIASEFISAFAIDPIVNQLKESLAKVQGLQGEQGGAGGVGAASGQMSTMGRIGTGVAGVGAGVGVGMGVSKMAGGGKMGGALGGMAGGAVAGAVIGSVIPGIGTAIGAVAGAIIGGIVGGIMAKEKSKTSIVTQTTPGFASSQETSAFSRSPFGIISMFDEAKVSKEVATSATMAIAEIDAAIAGYLDKSQREIVQNYFQSAVPEGSTVQSYKADDAIAKAIQQRLFQAITALQGEDVARNVVGELYTADKSNIQAIQARAMEALQILSAIADFKEGNLSATAQQIKSINEQFQQLADRATVLGLPLDEIMAEQQRQLTEITTNFNQEITDGILAITDPVAAEFAQLERLQKERIQNAIDAGADLVAVEKLNALEREELQKQLGQSADSAGNAIQQGLIDRLNVFTNATLSSTSQSIIALQQSFRQLESELIAAGMSTEALTASYREQATAMRHQAQTSVLSALFSITDPFRASMLQINQQVIEFQKLVDEGIVPQSTVDAFQAAATNQAREQEAQRREQEREQRRQEADQRRQQAIQFNQQLMGMINPTAAAFMQINEEIRQFQALADEGIISRSALSQFRRLALASAEIDRALQAVSGGGGSPIEQIADSFKSFIDAGGPAQSQSVQAMAALRDQFAGLAESAKILGLSTKDLEKSYLNQAQVIREQAIAAIDQEMQARRDSLKQIDDFLGKMRLSDALPQGMRFDEARAQFGEAVKSGNVQEAVAASSQYLDVARERFGSSSNFFAARNEVERMLTNLRDQQAANIEREREKLIRQEERQLEQVQIGRSSVDYLRRISTENTETSRGIAEMIRIARSQTSEQIETRKLLMRLAYKLKA